MFQFHSTDTSTKYATTISNNDNNLLSQILTCFDGRKTEFCGCSPVSSLLQYSNTIEAASEIQRIFDDVRHNPTIAAYIAAVLHKSSNADIKSNRKILLHTNHSQKMLEKEYRLMMESFLLGRNTLSTYLKGKNESRDKGWIRILWFCNNNEYQGKRKQRKKGLDSYEICILSFQICLLIGEGRFVRSERLLEHAWNVAEIFVTRKKKEIENKLESIQSIDDPASTKHPSSIRQQLTMLSPKSRQKQKRRPEPLSPTPPSPSESLRGNQTARRRSRLTSPKIISSPAKFCRSIMSQTKTKSKRFEKEDGKMNFVFSIDHGNDEDHANDDNENINNDNDTDVRPMQLQFHDDDDVAATIIDDRQILFNNTNDKFKSTIDTSLPSQYDIPNRITPTDTILNTTTTTDVQSSPPVFEIDTSHQSTQVFFSNEISPTETNFPPSIAATAAAAAAAAAAKREKKRSLLREKYPLLSQVVKSMDDTNDVDNNFDDLLNEMFEYCDEKKIIKKAYEEFGSDVIMNEVYDSLDYTFRAGNKQAATITIRRGNSREVKLHQVPTSADYDRFKARERKTSFLHNILDSIGAPTTEEAAGWVIAYLGKKHQRSLDWAGQVLKLPMFQKRMDTIATISMWQSAGIPLNAQRIIRQHLFCWFDGWLTVPEDWIRGVSDHYVRVSHGETIIDHARMRYWTKDLSEVIINTFINNWEGIVFDELWVIIGGDHGAGVFTLPVKIIAFDKDGNVVKDTVQKIGHIDCKKDTYAILKATITPIVNEAMKQIYDKFVCISEDGNDVSFVDSPQNQLNSSVCHKVELFAIGDLQYVAYAFGKIGMDGLWCSWCNLTPKQWSTIFHNEGICWTIDGFKDMLQKIQRDRLKGADRMGVVSEPLFDAIPVRRWIIPILHIMMGQFNLAFEVLLNYFDNRHEIITPEEETARLAYWKAKNHEIDRHEIFTATNAARQEDIQQIKSLIENIEEEKKTPATDEERIQLKRRSKFSNVEKKAMTQQVQQHKQRIKALQAEEKEEKLELKEVEADTKTKKKEMDTLKNRPGRKAECYISNGIDRILQDHGIDRAAFHGGKLLGTQCLTLERNILGIFDDLGDFLKSNHDNKVPHSEVDEVLECFRVHFLLLSHQFSLIMTPKTTMKIPEKKREILDALREVIDLVDKSTERLHISMKTPKRHLISDHVIKQMDAFDGIAETREEWNERSHQDYSHIDGKGKVRDPKAKAEYYSRQEALTQNEDVRERNNDVKELRKRNFKAERGPTKKEIKRRDRVHRRKRALTEFRIIYAIKKNLPTDLERNLTDCRNRQDGIGTDEDGAITFL